MKSKSRKASSPNARPTRTPLSRGKLWLFRGLALLLPVVLLGILEIALRLTGYGYPTSFFKPARIQDRDYYINNDTFSLRFFPPALARWPGTVMLPATKSPDTIRIFVFGESAAMGDPQPAYGASRYLEVLLRDRFPGKKFEVVNVAFTAINSHVILPIARECARRDGDLWIVYMGNNEMVGPFGAATVFGSQAPPRAMVRLNLAIQRTRVGQLAMAGLRRLAGKSANTTWGGMQMFLQNQVPANDPRRETVYRNFEGNLRDIVGAGLDSGAKVILNTMSVNLKDCPPFASLTQTNLPAANREAFQNRFAEAPQLKKDGRIPEALQKFAEADQIDPTSAELQFHWAETLRRLSNNAAGTNYQLACDRDALPFRADSRINDTIRHVGHSFSNGLVFSDAESMLASFSPDGLAGDEAFFEHVHFNFHGNYLVGRLWAEKVVQALPDRFNDTPPGEWASAETCDRNLGLTAWNRSFVIESVTRRMQQPPLSSQFNNPTRLANLQATLQTLRAEQAQTNAVMRTGQALVDAIQRAPHDAFLQEGFANFLESVGDRRQAAGAYRKMLDLLPHDFYAKLQLGRLHGELGQPAEGEPLLTEAAKQRPTVPEVWTELGDVQMAAQKFAAALESYTAGLKLRPQDPLYLCYQANAFARLGRNAEAIAAYRKAIQLRPGLAEAHFELAGLLVATNQIAEATREYTEAIRLRPDHAVSRINFGVVLSRQGRVDEAIQQFQVALQIDPRNTAAAEYLRQVSARRDARK